MILFHLACVMSDTTEHRSHPICRWNRYLYKTGASCDICFIDSHNSQPGSCLDVLVQTAFLLTFDEKTIGIKPPSQNFCFYHSVYLAVIFHDISKLQLHSEITRSMVTNWVGKKAKYLHWRWNSRGNIVQWG